MNITKQYIAGFIDGEGYMGIIKKSSKACIAGYYYTPALKIAQVAKNDEVLRAIQKFIGYGHLEARTTKQFNASNSTSLEIRGMKRVIPILEKLYPYLIVKKKQAKTLMDFAKLPSGTYNKSDKERTKLYEQIRFLNRRGLAETERKDTER